MTEEELKEYEKWKEHFKQYGEDVWPARKIN